MSRFTVTVLLAVALLGILLWVVISTVAQLANPQPLVRAPVEAPDRPDPSLPRLTTVAELSRWLDAQNQDGEALVEAYRQWLSSRGYPDSQDVLGLTDAAAHPYDDLDDVALLAIAGRGDIQALHTLAERSVGSNPIEALDWYDQAIVNGSIYAMLRVADLLSTLGDPALASFRSDPVWQQSLAEINAQSLTPTERALAWSIAAIHAGGYAVLDPHLADRITSLQGQLDTASQQRACDAAQTYVLEAATARRAQGGAVFAMDTPRFALSIAKPQQLLTCNVPVRPLVDMQSCDQQSFVGPGEQLWQSWICPAY